MVPYQRVVNHVFAETFQPLQIRTTSGRLFDVRHPDHLQLGRSSLTVYVSSDNDPDGPHRWEKITLESIESIDYTTRR
jgi:hypothetical protein